MFEVSKEACLHLTDYINTRYSHFVSDMADVMILSVYI